MKFNTIFYTIFSFKRLRSSFKKNKEGDISSTLLIINFCISIFYGILQITRTKDKKEKIFAYIFGLGDLRLSFTD